MAIEERNVGERLKARIELRELSDRELAALWHLKQAWNAFFEPSMEEDPHGRIDLQEFLHAVNTAENIIMARKFNLLDIDLREE